VIRDSWLENTKSRDLAVFVVWSPQLGAREGNVGEAASLLTDTRAHHFWDGKAVAGAAFERVLRSPGPAWDVWMLFDKQTRWEDGQTPDPAWWEHQLGGLPRDRVLDGKRFAEHAEQLGGTS
jgi:hypothetical protein